MVRNASQGSNAVTDACTSSYEYLGLTFLVLHVQLEIYGGEYEIEDLETGVSYFVRVFAKNQMVGWSDPASTTPLSMIPRAAPEVSQFSDYLFPLYWYPNVLLLRDRPLASDSEAVAFLNAREIPYFGPGGCHSPGMLLMAYSRGSFSSTRNARSNCFSLTRHNAE